MEVGELSSKYHPTDKMWWDILTKPMQGKFREMCCWLHKQYDVKVTDSSYQKPTGNVQEMMSFEQEGSSPLEWVGRSQKSVRWKENEIRLVPSPMTDKGGTHHLFIDSGSREKNLRRLEGRQGTEVVYE